MEDLLWKCVFPSPLFLLSLPSISFLLFLIPIFLLSFPISHSTFICICYSVSLHPLLYLSLLFLFLLLFHLFCSILPSIYISSLFTFISLFSFCISNSFSLFLFFFNPFSSSYSYLILLFLSLSSLTFLSIVYTFFQHPLSVLLWNSPFFLLPLSFCFAFYWYWVSLLYSFPLFYICISYFSLSPFSMYSLPLPPVQ